MRSLDMKNRMEKEESRKRNKLGEGPQPSYHRPFRHGPQDAWYSSINQSINHFLQPTLTIRIIRFRRFSYSPRYFTKEWLYTLAFWSYLSDMQEVLISAWKSYQTMLSPLTLIPPPWSNPRLVPVYWPLHFLHSPTSHQKLFFFIVFPLLLIYANLKCICNITISEFLKLNFESLNQIEFNE